MIGYVIRYPECIMDEVKPSIALLESKVDLRIVDLSEVRNIGSADFLIIPGGSCDEAIINAELHQVLKTNHENGKLIAGICNGALVLASAGILKQQKCTHTAVLKYAPREEFGELLDVAQQLFAGSTFVDQDVVVSENIVTAKPWASEGFAKVIAEKLCV